MHTSHPSAVADWLLVISEGLDRPWTMAGLVCCCRLTHHTSHSPPGALSVSWSSVSVWTGVREKFLQPPWKSEEPSRRQEQGWWSKQQCHQSAAWVRAMKMHCHCETHSTQHLAGAQWKAGHTVANTKPLHKDMLSSIIYWNYLSARLLHTFSLLIVVIQESEIQPKDNFSRSFYKKMQTLLALTVGAAGITHKNIL